MTPESRTRILMFLREPFPPGVGDLIPRWKERAASLGTEAIPVFLEMLKEGRWDEQYSSLLALREHGYEAWAENYGQDAFYRVRAPSSTVWDEIHPIHPDDKGFRDASGRWIEPPL